MTIKADTISNYVARNVQLVFRLFHKHGLVPKAFRADYNELAWRISDTPVGWDNKPPFEHLTHLTPQYEMRRNFRLDKHLVVSCFHPLITIGNHHEHNSINIQGTVRTQTRQYRHKYVHEQDWTFLNYIYAPDMDYDNLEQQIYGGAFQPEVLKRFINLEDKQCES